MTKELNVPAGVLQSAHDAWDAAADKLDGGWKRLDGASTAGFSPAVTAAVTAFCDTWTAVIRRQARAAQDHADAFVKVNGVYQMSDRAAAEQVRELLPWQYRNAGIKDA